MFCLDECMHMHAVPSEVREVYFRELELQVIERHMWVLRITLRASERAASALNH